MSRFFGWSMSLARAITSVSSYKRFAICRHKARQHIGQLSKETGAKLKSPSDSDRNSSSVSERLQFLALIFCSSCQNQYCAVRLLWRTAGSGFKNKLELFQFAKEWNLEFGSRSGSKKEGKIVVLVLFLVLKTRLVLGNLDQNLVLTAG